jgi:pimeloyl-ACP methyl ester carboxylesterase
MTKRIFLALLATLFVANVSAEPVEYPTNKDGSTITGVLTAGFDPLDTEGNGPVFPFPFNLFFLDLETLDITDLTLNIPADDPNDFSDPAVALSAIDGFSTSEKWTVTFLDGAARGRPPGQIDPASVVPGQSVRFFEVTTTSILVVTGIVRELVPGVDYVTTVADGSVLAIIPLKPLKELTSYMAVLTNDIKDTRGNNATPDRTYYLTQFEDPWVDENGNSTYGLIDDATAQTLAAIQPITQSMEAAAEAAGVVREDIILAWTAQTASVTPVLKHLRSIAQPAPTVVGPTGLTTGAIGGLGIADIHAGIITLPYYLGVPSGGNPTAPITDFWTAAPGAYVPPFDQLLPDKTSTNVTVANPFPIKTGDQTVPLLVTAPNANSGQTKPAAGWPVVVFGHGFTRSRADALAMADAAASVGFAVVAMDFPMHGISPDDPVLAPLYVGNGPFKDIANERTFDVDYVNNATGAPGPDGVIDPSGTHFLNLSSLLTTRDNMRQGSADLSVLAASLPFMSIDGDSLPDLDASSVLYVGHSLGAILGTPFVALEPTVTNAFLSAGMGGVARGFEASDTFGPRIRAGLAATGVMPGTADYEFFFTVLQTVLDSADPLNWAAESAQFNSIALHEIIGDAVVPNFVATAPLSGTEPLIAAMGLEAYASTQQNPNGVRIAGRFVPPADHGSLLSPAASPAATAEMQKQMASFLASRGKAVVVEDAATMRPTAAPAKDAATQPKSKQKLGLKRD